jgi:hypothetical protein
LSAQVYFIRTESSKEIDSSQSVIATLPVVERKSENPSKEISRLKTTFQIEGL